MIFEALAVVEVFVFLSFVIIFIKFTKKLNLSLGAVKLDWPAFVLAATDS